MRRRSSMKRSALFIAVPAIALLAAAAYIFINSQTSSAPKATTQDKTVDSKQEPAESKPDKAYTGQLVTVADTFTISVPNGWKASVSNAGSFRAIMFARPEQLNTLVYDAKQAPAVDTNGIPAWDGLTEHFFVLVPNAGKEFSPSSHREITSEPFTFNDGTVGTKYYVVKHAEEAAQYGGLLRDNEWQGRTYIYEKNGKHIEAHLALYPSSKVDKSFYESVVRTITAS